MAKQIYEVSDLSGAGIPEYYLQAGKALQQVAVKLIQEEIEVTELRIYMTADEMLEDTGGRSEGMLFPRFYYHGKHGTGYAVTPVEVHGLEELAAVPEDSCVVKAETYYLMIEVLRSAVKRCRGLKGMDMCVYDSMRNVLIRATGE